MGSFNEPIVRWLSEQAHQGIFVTDTAFTVQEWNRWMEQHSGRSAAQVVGRNLFDAFPDLRERHYHFYESALHGQAQVLSNRFHRYLIRMQSPHHAGNVVMQQSARIAPLVSEDRVVGIITVIEDVTERLMYEEELRRARDEAEAATRSKDRFIAVLSHDLRTPLSGIMGWAQLLHKGKLDAERVQRAHESILRSASVQLQMIDELLDISRISTGSLRLEFEVVDLLELVQSAVEPLRPTMDTKGVEFKQLLPKSGRTAAVDPQRIKQVVWNLLSNAVKFTPRGGTVELELEFQPEIAELRVKDTGAGISPEALPRVFEPMWQASESSAKEGLGLGLAIVRHVVAGHGGSVRAESDGIGHGACFVVELPWQSPAASHIIPGGGSGSVTTAEAEEG